MVAYKPLKKYLEIYGTSDGELIFEQTFDATNSFFPQYISELRGIADGANVKFEKVTLFFYCFILYNNACIVVFFCFIAFPDPHGWYYLAWHRKFKQQFWY